MASLICTEAGCRRGCLCYWRELKVLGGADWERGETSVQLWAASQKERLASRQPLLLGNQLFVAYCLAVSAVFPSTGLLHPAQTKVPFLAQDMLNLCSLVIPIISETFAPSKLLYIFWLHSLGGWRSGRRRSRAAVAAHRANQADVPQGLGSDQWVSP